MWTTVPLNEALRLFLGAYGHHGGPHRPDNIGPYDPKGFFRVKWLTREVVEHRCSRDVIEANTQIPARISLGSKQTTVAAKVERPTISCGEAGRALGVAIRSHGAHRTPVCR